MSSYRFQAAASRDPVVVMGWTALPVRVAALVGREGQDLPAGSPRGRPGTRSRTRRWLSAFLHVLIALVCVSLALVIAGYLIAPGVGDAEARAHRVAIENGGSDYKRVSDTRLAQAVVAVEDRRFYDHGALDLIALGRSTWARIDGSAADPGGSTISQQLARLLYGQRPSALGPVQDILVAFKLENEYSKRQILEMYLTAAYFGGGAYGVQQASLRYFHKRVQRLDWAEATMLAGLPQAPSAFDPRAHFDRARIRQREVLQAVVRAHLLSATQAEKAFRELRRLGE